jgi:thermitase
MASKRSRLPMLLTVALLSTLIGAGSVFAAMPRPSLASALKDYDADTPALKAADLNRALAADGGSPDRVVVMYRDGVVDEATLARVHELVGGTPLSGDRALGREVLRVTTSGGAASAVERLRAMPGIAEVRVEQTVAVGASPVAGSATNDPYASFAWGVSRVGANQVWGTSTGSGIKVAVLDCGIHSAHPDLAGQVVLEKNFTASPTADDLCNHGTHVAGTIAALTNNGLGVPSIAPGVRLMDGKVADDTGHGFFTDFENGLRWAADNGARVVNLSLGANVPCAASSQAAVNYARARGVVIVAGAGNAGLSRAASPASCAGVVAVGAVDENDVRASFSNTGAGVALAAPGVRVGSTVNPDVNGGVMYALLSGTSMAAPHAAGVAALLWASGYGTSADAVVGRLESTADHIGGTGSLWAYGRINALRAVGAPPPTATPTSLPATATPIPSPTEIPPTATAVPTAAPTTVPPTATARATAVPVGTRVSRTATPVTAVLPPIAPRGAFPPTTPVARLTTAPAGVTAVPTGRGQVQVAWQAPADGRTTFNIYRGDANGGDMRLLAAGLAPPTRTFIDPSAPLGQTVTYAIAAQNAAGEGPHSPPARTTTPSP